MNVAKEEKKTIEPTPELRQTNHTFLLSK